MVTTSPEGGSDHGPRTPRYVRWIPFAVFALLPAIVIRFSLASGEFLFGSDVIDTFYYYRALVGDSLASLRLPTWDTLNLCGFPLLADPQSAVFYPPNWLFAIFPAGGAWTFLAWLHLALAGTFTFLWLRRALGIEPWGAMCAGILYISLASVE